MSFGDWLQNLRSGSWSFRKVNYPRRPRCKRSIPVSAQVQVLEPRRLLSGVTAMDDSYSFTIPAESSEPLTLDVLANDDGNGETPAVTSVTSPANGSAVVLTASESGLSRDVIVVTPNSGFEGDLVFSYTIGNSLEESDTATVTVSVENQDPILTYWETPEGIAILASFDSARGALDDALIAAAEAANDNDLAAWDGFLDQVEGIANARALADEAAYNVFGSAMQGANATETSANAAAQAAYNAAVTAAAAARSSGDQAALATYNSAVQQAGQAQTSAIQTARSALDSAANGATATEQGSVASAGATYTGIAIGASQSYQSAAQAAYDAYYVASSNYNGPGGSIPFSQWSDSTYASDMAAAGADYSGAVASAESQYQSDVGSAYITYQSGTAAADAAYYSALIDHQATYDTAVLQADADYQDALAGNQATYSQDVQAAGADLADALVANQAAYDLLAASADATYGAALATNEESYKVAIAAAGATAQADLAANQTAYEAAISTVYTAFDAAISAADADYFAVADDPNSSTGDIEDARDVWEGEVELAYIALINGQAGAVAGKNSADGAVDVAYAHALNAEATSLLEANMQAANAHAQQLNAAAASQWLADVQAQTVELNAIHTAGAQHALSDSQAAEVNVAAVDAAAAQQSQDDAQAGQTLASALTPLDAAYLGAVATAEAAYDDAVSQANADYSIAEQDALAASMGRWAASEGTPEAQLEADLQAAAAAVTATTAPAGASYEEAVHAAAAQWVSTVSPAWTTFKNAVASQAQTYANAVLSALQSLTNATSGNALTYAQSVVPAAQQLADDQAANAEAWFASMAPATRQLLDAQGDNAEAAYNDFVCGEQTFADAVTDNAAGEATDDITATVAYVSAVAPGAAAFLAANQQPGEVPAAPGEGPPPAFVALTDFLSLQLSEVLTTPIVSLGVGGVGVNVNNPFAQSPSSWQSAFMDAVSGHAPETDAFPSLPLFHPTVDPSGLFTSIAVDTLVNVLEPDFQFDGSPMSYLTAGTLFAGAAALYEGFGDQLAPDASISTTFNLPLPNWAPLQLKQKLDLTRNSNPGNGQSPFWSVESGLSLSPQFSQGSRLRWLNNFSLDVPYLTTEIEHLMDYRFEPTDLDTIKARLKLTY